MTKSSSQVEALALGARLRSARETAGLTQNRAAKELGVARTTIVAIEKGERRVNPAELVKLGRLYGELVSRLLRPTALIPDLVLQFRRSRARPTSDDDSVETTKLLQRLAASYVELEERLDVPLVAHYPPEYRIRRSRLVEQAEDLAQEIRHVLGVGPRAPVHELERMLESEFGLRIFTRLLPSHIAGAFAFHEALGACVLLNARHPRTRRLWTLAHEFGHFLTNRHSVDVLRLQDDHLEPFADLFAGSLLLPAAEMRRRFAESHRAEGKFSARHLIYLASAFGVSIEAITRRFERLGLLASGTYEMLRERGLSEHVVDEVVGKPQDAHPRSPSRFGLLAGEAYDRAMLTEGQVASMLGLDRVETRELLDLVEQVGLTDELPE